MFDIGVYDPDGIIPNRAVVRAIRAAGDYAICYVDAGTSENWRPDATRFARDLLGRPNGWPGERWLRTRNTSILLPLMAARVAMRGTAGFEGVEFDNVDGYASNTSFPNTFAKQLRYKRDLAALAHRDGLAAGRKNDYGQVKALQPYFDFAVDEQCAEYAECALLEPLVSRHQLSSTSNTN
ncbi:MAG TPA: endo alpha-1,4 polygalactosaminidase [Candidatus Dormibacteraeota bacterium]|nr:endo alpha-1,4 polygalactosaminidase [Candidatus Dormibacteraeota bacterium]